MGLSFASCPRDLLGFSGCTCSSCPNPPGRVFGERGEHRGMDDVQLACSVPAPTMHLSRLEDVVEKKGPHWGITVVITFSCWGRRSPGKRPEEPTSVIESRQSCVGLVSGCSVRPGPARWGTPPCRPGLLPWGSSRWSSDYLSCGPSPLYCHSRFLPHGDPASQFPLQGGAEGLGSHPALLCSLPYPTPAPPWCLRVSGCSGIYSCFHLLGVAP